MRKPRSWEYVPLILSVNDVCQLLSLSKPTVLKAVNEGQIPASKVGNRWIVTKDNLKTFLKEN